MMSYFPASMPMYPKSHASNLSYNGWYPPGMNYHHPSANGQFLDSDISPHQAAMYYGNPHIFQASPDWSHEFPGSAGAASSLQAPSAASIGLGSGPITGPHTNVGSSAPGDNADSSEPSLSINESGLQSLPSPPVTVSGGSEMSSPGAPQLENGSPQTASLRPTPTKSPYHWMTKNHQPQTGKTRTKDKYRVVYTEFQRLELEKEYHTSRYITIRRKSELALSLQLSERQVKIWFQNRRAKERKTDKKKTDPMHHSSAAQVLAHHHQQQQHHQHHQQYQQQHHVHQHQQAMASLAGALTPTSPHIGDLKLKLEPGLHHPELHNGPHHHPLHQISAMNAMGMGSLSLHHAASLHHSQYYNMSTSPLSSIGAAAAAVNQQHQQHQQQQQHHQLQMQNNSSPTSRAGNSSQQMMQSPSDDIPI